VALSNVSAPTETGPSLPRRSRPPPHGERSREIVAGA
jgi:hypothetical protein